jgi:hypothetical protein
MENLMDITDPILDHPLVTARYFNPWPNHFDNPCWEVMCQHPVDSHPAAGSLVGGILA